MISREDLKHISVGIKDYGGGWRDGELYYKGKLIATYPCSGHVDIIINEENYQRLERDEKIDKELKEAIPKEDLTEEEFNEAKRLWEERKLMFRPVKYINSIRPKEGLKWAKTYFDLYIDDRNYDTKE